LETPNNQYSINYMKFNLNTCIKRIITFKY